MRITKMALGVSAAMTMAALGVRGETGDLESQVRDLRDQVAALQMRQAENAAGSAEIVERILRDAENRTQLMSGGESGAGYDNGFYIRSGDFVLKPGAVMQFRGVADYRSDTADHKESETETGFELRRVQFKLEGSAFSKDLTYAIQWNTDRNAGSMFLEDAWVKYMFTDTMGIKGGQYKEPFFREKVLSDSKLMSVDRSLLDAALGGGWSDRVQGVSFLYGNYSNGTPVNVELAVTDGANSDNTDYTGHYPNDPAFLGQVSSPGGHTFDYGVAGRVEYKLMGDWKNYSEYTARGVKESLLVLGGGFEYNQGGDGAEFGGTVDLTYKMTNGLAFSLAGIVRNMDKNLSSLGKGQTDWGAQGMVSYLINNQWEPFARYTYVNYDSEIGSVKMHDDFHEISVGVAYYMGKGGEAGHRAKITVDLNWLPNGAPGAMTGQGYLGDSGGEDEVSLRAQFQLVL